MCKYSDTLISRIRINNILNVTVSTIVLLFLFIITIPYNSEYLPTSNNHLFFTNLIVISITFIPFLTHFLNKYSNKLLLSFNVIFTFFICVAIVIIFCQNLLVYNKGELIKNFNCENVQLKDQNLNGLDVFMIQTDQLLCSDDCICRIKEMRDFEMKVDQVSLNQWNVNSLHGSVNIQSCMMNEISEKIMLKGKISEKDVFFYLDKERNESLDFSKFTEFWGYVEETFSCSGFCINSYLNNIGVRTSLTKYLFTDVNLGVPKIHGCYETIKIWVNQYYFYSSISFFILFFPYLSSFSLQIYLLFFSKERPYQKASQVNYTDKYENSLQMTDLFSS